MDKNYPNTKYWADVYYSSGVRRNLFLGNGDRPLFSRHAIVGLFSFSHINQMYSWYGGEERLPMIINVCDGEPLSRHVDHLTQGGTQLLNCSVLWTRYLKRKIINVISKRNFRGSVKNLDPYGYE